MNPMKNMTLWPCFQVSTPAESRQINQRRPSSPPHKYHWLMAKSTKLSFVAVGREPHTRVGMMIGVGVAQTRMILSRGAEI
jgi:hypothetical protein